MDDTFLNNLYKGITVTDRDALDNRLNFGYYWFKKDVKKYVKPTYYKNWDEQLIMVNAFYNFDRNLVFSHLAI